MRGKLRTRITSSRHGGSILSFFNNRMISRATADLCCFWHWIFITRSQSVLLRLTDIQTRFSLLVITFPWCLLLVNLVWREWKIKICACVFRSVYKILHKKVFGAIFQLLIEESIIVMSLSYRPLSKNVQFPNTKIAGKKYWDFNFSRFTLKYCFMILQ